MNEKDQQSSSGTPKSPPSEPKSKPTLIRWVLIVVCMLIVAFLVIDPFAKKDRRAQDQPDLPPAPKLNYSRIEPDLSQYEAYFKNDFSKELKLLASIRNALENGTEVQVETGYQFAYHPEQTRPYVTLFQAGETFIRWGASRQSFKGSLDRIVKKLRSHDRFARFDVSDPAKTRILFEIVQETRRVNLNDLVFGYSSPKDTRNKLMTNRFEPGITGLKCQHGDRTSYYLPTDATTRSHLSKNHVLGQLADNLRVAPGTKKRNDRIAALKGLNLTCTALTSKAFVTFEDQLIPLYRGHPAILPYSKEEIRRTMLSSVDWLVQNMNSDGSFLYYYDPVADTIVDHAHPKRSMDNLYNNILRHSGGTITLIRAFELTQDHKYLAAAKRSLDFLISTTRKRDIGGKTAYYAFFNKKSKLGGTGTGLAAIMRYYMASGDAQFNEYATGMARHLLSRIENDGEMIGYYIHPKYNNGEPLLTPTAEQKKKLFSFYYPGEALLGLALYEREMSLDPAFKQEIRTKCKKALDFLVDSRPKKYASLFTALPSDGWLMQAIEEWSKDPEFRRQAYLDFVYNDANSMIEHMYNTSNSLYFDNPGTFFYNYGDHAYTDGARAEGLIAAYYLAKRMGKTALAEKFLEANILVAKSLLPTYHSKASSFAFPAPKKAIGSFRFKLTRQWVRVDSVQHTACFFARLFGVL
ncbi:MAG: protein containing Six-hairpin glycosidase-like domain protein [Myxococcota bacterium]|nr:protein containing Six-hairpin glycosidase-like domain protein [Myxococcota bacterium]